MPSATGAFVEGHVDVALRREERPGLEHEAFTVETSAVSTFRWAQRRWPELKLRELRQEWWPQGSGSCGAQEVNDILNGCLADGHGKSGVDMCRGGLGSKRARPE